MHCSTYWQQCLQLCDPACTSGAAVLEVLPQVDAKAFKQLTAHLAEAEDIAVVDVVRLVLRLRVGGQEDLAVRQQVGVCAAPKGVVARRAAWEPVL